MRRLLALLVALAAWPLAAALPTGVPAAPPAPVVDLAGMLSDGARSSLDRALRAARDGGGFQLAVLTLPDLEGRAIEDVSVEVARAWALGDRERGDGVLLLVAPAQRALRIEVGSRLEGELPDAVCARIIRQEMAPRLRQGDADGAVAAGCAAIAERLGRPLALGRAAPPRRRVTRFPLVLILLLIAAAFSVLRLLAAGPGVRRRSSWGSGPRGMGGFGQGGFGGGGFGGGGGYSGGGGGFSGGGASGGW